MYRFFVDTGHKGDTSVPVGWKCLDCLFDAVQLFIIDPGLFGFGSVVKGPSGNSEPATKLRDAYSMAREGYTISITKLCFMVLSIVLFALFFHSVHSNRQY